ncbi:putative carboxylesterase 3 [Rosellinia necatrix]|uniref:Putative carboxylesterase 3 n=1 Tax=Rosellinia necatrix TaxID=77044 RepID=A0A1W2TR93_ROSNE|nr:putative carboxylesterase 3 [Rosellinia necatrix]
MKDALLLQLPSWPSRVLFLRHGRRGAATNDDNDDSNHSRDISSGSSTDDTDLEVNKPPAMVGSEPAYQRLQSPGAPVPRFRRRRIRWALFSILIFGTVTIILLSTLLSRHAVGGFDTLFKKTCNITLPQGNYLGQVIGPSTSSPRAIQAFVGIPYAKSTAGENRFQPPQPLDIRTDSDVLYHALKYGEICPQGKPGTPGQGENCLNVNIYRPHFGDDATSIAAEEQRLSVDSKKLPVVVYVHGGGFNMGCGKERDMASFAAFADSPIVALSFNYRVGPLGFLPSAVTAKHGLLNLGLKDQQFFFEWMKANLPNIGGDPDNVTIMGLSAGSHSIGHHLISYSPANKLISGPPPFQKAIIESGGATARAVFVPDHPLHELQLKEFLMQCGIYGVSDDELFDKLRDLPYSTVVSGAQAMWKTWSSTLRWPFQPVIDGPGGVIPDLPINSWRKGNVLRIPILTGFNTNEGAGFVPEYADDPSAVRTLMASIIPALNETDLGELDKLYPALDTTQGKTLYAAAGQSKRFGTQFWRLDDAYAHYAYICPVLQTATLASTADGAPPVYVYHYAARSSSFGAADHADEAPIVAHNLGAIGKYPGLVATADAMTGAWTRFAVTGDPNLSHSGAKAQFTWPRYTSPFNDNADADAGRLALFGEGNDEEMGFSGTRNRGTPAQSIALTKREMNQCKYWWPRVVLSEGYANGSTSFTPEEVTIKAKL